MKRILTAVSMMILMFVVAVQGQSSTPKPAPAVKQLDAWVGDWTFSGTTQDSPAGPEEKVEWRPHVHWILGGFFVEFDSIWKANGEAHFVEILGYDPVKKVYTVSGFGDDGETWAMVATFNNETYLEDLTMTSPDGKVRTCHHTFIFSSDRMAATGTSECEQGGVHWTDFKLKGTKSK
jgi:hypothetical protein